MKSSRSVVKSLTKDFIKGNRRLYWYSYTKLKYFFCSINALLLNKKINNLKISLLLPTRERSKKFTRLIDSINETCTNKQKIEILLLLDEDDNELNEYYNIAKYEKYKLLNIKIFVKNFKTHSERNNFLAKNSYGDIIFPINDDIIFNTRNWDLEIDREFSKIGNSPYSLWINCGQKYNYLHCDFPIINREWYKRLGYVGSEFFKFWYLDTWICDLSFRSKKFLITDKIEVFQYSAHTLKDEVDNTHLKNLRNDIPRIDFITWQNTKKYRITDAKKLK